MYIDLTKSILDALCVLPETVSVKSAMRCYENSRQNVTPYLTRWTPSLRTAHLDKCILSDLIYLCVKKACSKRKR